MKTKRKYVVEAADPIIEALKPFCKRVEIVGSVRRGEEMVGDLDILCEPNFNIETSLFDGENSSDKIVSHADGINWNNITGVKNVSGGMRMKKGLVHTRIGNIKFQIFFCLPPAQWGVLCFIRTGPAWLSHAAVSSYERTNNGILPNRYQVKDGNLRMRQTGAIVDTPEESDFMNRLSLNKKFYKIKNRKHTIQRRKDV